MRKASTRYVLLGTLAMAGEMTGFEIRAFIDQSVSFFWRESYGQIYPELKRLAAEDLVEAATPRKGGREAQPYRVTEAGRSALADWLARPAQVQPVRDETLLKLFFSRQASTGTAAALIAAARAGANARLWALEAAERLVLGEPGDADLLYSLTVISRGLAAARANLDWCDRADALREAWEAGGADQLIKRWREG